MITRRLIGLSAALTLLVSPSIADAQSCSALAQKRSALQGRMAQLVADYPGTHMVIGMCAASAASEYERTSNSDDASSSFAICAGIGCLLVGFQNCVDITTQWFSMALEDEQILDRIKAC